MSTATKEIIENNLHEYLSCIKVDFNTFGKKGKMTKSKFDELSDKIICLFSRKDINNDEMSEIKKELLEKYTNIVYNLIKQ